MKYSLYLFFIGCILFSCSAGQHDLHQLDHARSLIDYQPDSAMQALNRIKHPDRLSPGMQADYRLLLIEAALDTREALPPDSLAEASIAYYTSVKDTANLLRALFWAGTQNRMLNAKEKALSYLEQAEAVAESYANDSILCRIWRQKGYTFQDMDRKEEAVAAHEKALTYALRRDDPFTWSYYWSLGTVYQDQQAYEQAVWAYQQALALTDSSMIDDRSPIFYDRMALVYSRMKAYDKAFEAIDRRQDIPVLQKNRPAYYLTKGKLFLEALQFDSARFFLNKAITVNNPYISTMAYALLMNVDKVSGNYESAIRNKMDGLKEWDTAATEITLREMQKQYADEKLKNENNLLKLAKREREIYLLLAGLLLALVFVYLAYLKRKKTLFHLQTLKDKALLLENQNLLLHQAKELSALHEKAAVLRAALFRHLPVAGKIPSLDSIKERKPEENRRISLSESDWDELLRTIREAYPDFIDNIKKQGKELTKEDICFCCLVKIHVDLQDLSDIYCISKQSVTKKKLRMKKDKLLVTDETMSLDDFLDLL